MLSTIRFTGKVVLQPSIFARLPSKSFCSATVPTDAVGAKNTQSSDDRLRVNNAMKVKNDEITKNAESFTSNSAGAMNHYSYSSVDFGNTYNLPHPIWSEDFVDKVKPIHVPTKDWVDTLALWTIKTIRFNFDWASGWSFGKPTIGKALIRLCFLETVAGVPGSIGGILRHLASLRRMRRDNGWIHTLMEEAENERMHLLTFLELKKPGPFFRTVVWLTQGIFFNFYFVSYILSPRFCHRLVGYLEDQAVVTYTHMLEEIDNGNLKEWRTTPAPEIAKNYWKLPANATMRDVIVIIRADEAHHRDVNHGFAAMKPSDPNPFLPGY